jgi:hypothetical protein
VCRPSARHMTVARNLAGEPRRTWIEMDLYGRPAVVAPALAAVVLEDRTQEEHALSVTASPSPSHGMVAKIHRDHPAAGRPRLSASLTVFLVRAVSTERPQATGVRAKLLTSWVRHPRQSLSGDRRRLAGAAVACGRSCWDSPTDQSYKSLY